MFLLDICDDSAILTNLRIVKIIINAIKVVVPLLLIVSATMTFVKATKDGSNSKAFNELIIKCVAAMAIFFIPTLVFMIDDETAGNSKTVMSCFNKATIEGIKAAKVEEAKLKVINAKNLVNEGAYTAAASLVNDLDDSSEKQSMLKDLDGVKSEIEEVKRKKAEMESSTGISKSGKYTKAEIIAMSEEQVRAMNNQEFIEFIASAAQIVYSEYGGCLPSITIAQAILESGYGDHFETTSHNVYGLIGYPGDHPKVSKLRKFDNFYEATYYHTQYFYAYSNVYGNFLNNCAAKNALGAATSLSAYAGGSQSYPGTIQTLINQYNLTQYDF